MNSKTSFRITLPTMFWVVALIAAAIGAFGIKGIVLPTLVLVYWFAQRKQRKEGGHVGLSLLFGFGVMVATVFVLLPAVQSAHVAARRSVCISHLKQLSLAILNYEADKGTFPPAQLVDDNGVPQHSWRVLILPYIEEQALFDAYRFDEPWDGPNNKKLINQMPNIFDCPEHGTPGHTRYAAVIGSGPVWTNPQQAAESTSIPCTALLAETFVDVPWTKPSDFTAEELIAMYEEGAGDMLAGGHHYADGWSQTPHLVGFVYTNMATAYLAIPDDLEHLRAASQGEVKRIATWRGRHNRKVRWGRVISLVSFFGLALLPWFVLKRRKPGKSG